jgi:CubicO group peptidase (beta-lactamase class C family)
VSESQYVREISMDQSSQAEKQGVYGSSISRRQLLTRVAPAGLAGAVLASVSFPSFALAATDVTRADGDPWISYYGVTGSQHQSNFNLLSGKGYGMISVSVYGDPADPRYAAVWLQGPGPARVAIHGVDKAGYQAFVDTSKAKGYVPTVVSATGSAQNAVFAAIAEQGINRAWIAHHDMVAGDEKTAGTLQNYNLAASQQKMVLFSVAIYGTPTDRRYAAIWHANPGYTKWEFYPSESIADYQNTFNAETQLPGYALSDHRPTYVTLSNDQVYCSVFRDDRVGPWTARHNLTAAAYQAEFDAQKAKGFFPITLQGGGTGDQTRYAAIFAGRTIPESRLWSVTGAPNPTLSAFDDLMKNFMQTHGIRAGQLTIAKNGVTKLARAYTWAEDGYRQVQPSDRFLLASCSKIFTSAAIQSLYDANQLTPTTTAYPLLGFSGPTDSRSDQITIQNLLDHQGGFDSTKSGDPTYSMRDIAIKQKLDGPVGKLDIAQYMYTQMLDFQPGTVPDPRPDPAINGVYSNYGYHLLSLVVEHVTGMDFFGYVQQALLQPANITEVLLSSTLANQRPANQAICEDQGLGLSPLDLTSPLQVPFVYGGDGMIKEVAAGSAGIASSATALTQFIHQHAVWGNGPRAANNARIGSTPGAYSWAYSRTDGVDWVFVFNTRDWAPDVNKAPEGLATRINSQLDLVPIV